MKKQSITINYKPLTYIQNSSVEAKSNFTKKLYNILAHQRTKRQSLGTHEMTISDIYSVRFNMNILIYMKGS